MPKNDYQTNMSSVRNHKNTSGIANKSDWRCRICGHVNLAGIEYCSKCGFRLGVQRYLR